MASRPANAVRAVARLPRDLVVTDPVQAGIMTVMAVASTARFDIHRGRRY